MSKGRVVVGLSGGVDSSVAAWILKEEGYEVIGMFMKNWHDESVTISNECPWLEDSNDALLVAQKLGIPFQTIDLSADYKERIVDYMFHEYQNGRTPNPDVLCNREIKFDIFLKTALKLKADFVATGHYCRKSTSVINGSEVHSLLAGKDENKDQSYFLCQLNQDQLSKALFPIGELTKPEVRKIATDLDLVTAEKKDSQGLCFIGKVKLPDFLQQQLKPKKGKVLEVMVEDEIFENNPLNMSFSSPSHEELKRLTQPFSYIPDGRRLAGNHNGAHYFTIGQRKGLGIGGTPEPLFVIETDTKANIVYTGQGDQHPGLFRRGLFIKKEDLHWVRKDLALKPNESQTYLFRIRYRQTLHSGKLFAFEEGAYLIFDEPMKGITPGQFAVWYQGDELIGSGVIAK